ncbi:MAG: TolC family protein [Bacteroidota bacterium]
MRKLLTISVLFLCFFSFNATAQTFEGPREEWPDQKLAPLEVLIERAVEFSFPIRLAQNQIEQKRLELTEERQKLLQPLRFNMSMDYGNGNYLTATGNGTEVVESFVLNNQAFLTFRVGLGLNLPLSDLFTKRTRIHLKERVVEQFELQQDQLYIQIREDVIKAYNQFMFAIRLVETSQEALNNSELAYLAIEKRFRTGNVTVDEFVRSLQNKNNDLIRLEENRLKSRAAYQALKALVGQDIH